MAKLRLSIQPVRDGFQLIHHNKAGFMPMVDEFLRDPEPIRADTQVHHSTERDTLERFSAQYGRGFHDVLRGTVGNDSDGHPWSRGYLAGLKAGYDEKRARTFEQRERLPWWFYVAVAAAVAFIGWQVTQIALALSMVPA